MGAAQERRMVWVAPGRDRACQGLSCGQQGRAFNPYRRAIAAVVAEGAFAAVPRLLALLPMSKNPSVGQEAPDFCLPSTCGEIRLSDRLKQRAVLLVFYPGDGTPVCTRQLCNYRDNIDALSGLGVEVLAVNPQPLDSHEGFAGKHKLPFPLLSDADKTVCRAYGALSLLGMAKRALVLVGQDGRIKYRRTDFPLFYRSAEELRQVLTGLDGS